MNPEERKKLIEAARTGNLTEEEYDAYYQLLLQHPEWLEQQAQDDAISKAIVEADDEDFYDAAQKLSLPRYQPHKKLFLYQIAAAVAFLVVAGVGYWWLTRSATPPLLIAVQNLDFYNGDPDEKNQLAYAEGDFAVGDLTLAWYSVPSQTKDVMYTFCNDTLGIYLRDSTLRVQLQPRLRLEYRPSLQHYELKGIDSKKAYSLNPCTTTPQLFVP